LGTGDVAGLRAAVDTLRGRSKDNAETQRARS
jgi:hypothetical protein